MDSLQALTLFGGAFLIIAAAAAIGLVADALKRRRAAHPRDELMRAGTTDSPDPESAALSALGSTAWMRPGGGGF